jgi:hypothetical protein
MIGGNHLVCRLCHAHPLPAHFLADLPRCEELPCLGLPGPTTYSQGTQEKGTEEHDNADDQQIQQALGDDTHDAEHDRDDHEE